MLDWMTFLDFSMTDILWFSSDSWTESDFFTFPKWSFISKVLWFLCNPWVKHSKQIAFSLHWSQTNFTSSPWSAHWPSFTWAELPRGLLTCFLNELAIEWILSKQPSHSTVPQISHSPVALLSHLFPSHWGTVDFFSVFRIKQCQRRKTKKESEM